MPTRAPSSEFLWYHPVDLIICERLSIAGGSCLVTGPWRSPIGNNNYGGAPQVHRKLMAPRGNSAAHLTGAVLSRKAQACREPLDLYEDPPLNNLHKVEASQ